MNLCWYLVAGRPVLGPGRLTAPVVGVDEFGHWVRLAPEEAVTMTEGDWLIYRARWQERCSGFRFRRNGKPPRLFEDGTPKLPSRAFRDIGRPWGRE